MCLDKFTTDALALLTAAGKTAQHLTASQTSRNGKQEHYLYAQADVAGLPWPETLASAMEPTAEAALSVFAQRLGVTYPLPATVYATNEQQERLISLLNDYTIKLKEKTKMLLTIDTLTTEQAEEAIAQLLVTIADRRQRYTVVGMAEFVQPQPLAA